MTNINRLNQKNNSFSIEMFLPFFMFFVQYKIGPVSVGVILLMFVAVFTLLKFPKCNFFSLNFWPYYVFLAYIIFCDIFRTMLGPNSIQTGIINMIEYVTMFLCVFIVCSPPFDEDKLYKYWKIAGVIFTAGIVYHVVQIYVFKQNVSAITIIPGYVLRPEDSFDQLRPSSFFAEPAAFTISMFPLLFLSLKRNDLMWAFFCSFSILLSTSTVGVILSAVLWVATIMKNDFSVKKKFSVVLVVVLIAWMFTNMEIFNVTQSKFLAVMEGESTFGSRVLTGFELVKNLSFSDLFFGTRYNDVGNFISDNLEDFVGCDSLIKYWKSQRLFLNTFSRLIFQYGIAGLILFLVPLIHFFCQRTYGATALIIMMLVAIFGQTMLLNAYFFSLTMVFLLYENDFSCRKIVDEKSACLNIKH